MTASERDHSISTDDEEPRLRERLEGILRADALAWGALTRAQAFHNATKAAPEWRIVAGCLYQAVWNHLTGRPAGHGVNDVDLAYYDASDLSWDAEDAVIRAGAPWFADLGAPIEIKNQARVHLWYEARFGQPYAPLDSVADGVRRYASRTHAIAAHLDDADRIEIFAPYGLSDVFAMRITPNRIMENRETHERKAMRAKAHWPELTVAPW